MPPDIIDVDDCSVMQLPTGGRDVDLLALAAASPERYPFLLESSAGAAAQSRYDLLLAFPGEALELPAREPTAFDFFSRLDAACAHGSAPNNTTLPFVGGWFLYMGYEAAAQVEPSLRLPPADPALPCALAVRCPAAVIHDRQRQTLHFVTERRARDRVLTMWRDWQAAAGRRLPAAPIPARLREAPADAFRSQVRSVRELIHAGDIFQANLSRVWRGELCQATDPAALYAALRAANPAPFSGLMRWRGAAVISSSPERLLSVAQGVARTRPIAGTRPRDVARDVDDTREMLAHPKERAEHVMLIDLERNDLGRVCVPGSIRVDELMVAETYAHVHHIVSGISGRLRADVGPGAALRAVFPGGTITGCPKVRCMEIIAELEREGRGPYTGSFGYISRCGRLDTNILIRSISQVGQRITLRAGGGIVADSNPDRELEETRAKARGVLKSLDILDTGAPHA